jgi:hypothetical protein
MVGRSDQKARIIAAVKNIDALMLTRGAHIEHFQLLKKELFQFSCGCEQFH